MFWVWLAVIAVAIIIEILTLDLVSVWFAFGAVIPFILAAVGGIAIEIQIAVFVIVSALLIIFMRSWARKLLFKNMNEKTNINSIIGKKIRLLEDTDFEHLGSLKINDVTWTAVSHDGGLIKAGQIVEVVKVDGNKLLVKEIEGKINNESVENTQKDINTDKNKEKIINNNNTNENSEDNEKKSEEETQLIQNSTVAIENSEKTLEEETKINKETKETSDASQGTIIATTDDKKEGE